MIRPYQVSLPTVLTVGTATGCSWWTTSRPPTPPSAPAGRDSAGRVPGPVRTDSAVRRDTTPPLPDSLSPDSFRPQLPPLGAPPGPVPQAGRLVFDRDALWFSGALTLGELLQRVPGVFLVRAGWFGRPEVVQYAGQGASSIEVVWDGYAMDPLGEDSTGLDLSEHGEQLESAG